MALKLKYTDEHGILHINMSPTSSAGDTRHESDKTDITDPKFDTINNRFGQYDLFGGKYDDSGGEELQRSSLFRSRYNSVEEELANTPYAFTTERALHLKNLNNFDITIEPRDLSPSRDIEDDRFFNRNIDVKYENDLFGPQIDFELKDETPAFTVTQLIHAQDRYFDLSSRQSSTLTERAREKVKSDSVSVKSAPTSASSRGVKSQDDRTSTSDVTRCDAFKVLGSNTVKAAQPTEPTARSTATPISKRKRETSFAILPAPPSRPTSPSSLPSDTRRGRVSPFRGRGFREETSRHNTPRTSAANSKANSRASSPSRRRTSSLSKIDSMADTAFLPPPLHTLNLTRPRSPQTPRDFVKENIEEVRELSELNRELHEAEAEKKRVEEEEALLKEMGLIDAKGVKSVVGSKNNSRTTSRCSSPAKIKIRSRSNSPTTILHFEIIPAVNDGYVNGDSTPQQAVRKSRVRSVSRSQPQSNNGSPKHSKIPKRQSSVSPNRNGGKWDSTKRPFENNLNRNQRFISNSTSSIHETAKIEKQLKNDKKTMSKSQQHLSLSPAHIRGKPPISPGRGGPPPSNKTINAKRLSPIVGTPNKSPSESSKPGSARTPTKPTTTVKKPAKTVGNTPAVSRFNSRQPSRSVSRDHSPDKRKPVTNTPASKPKPATKPVNKTVSRTPSDRTIQKPVVPPKIEPKKPINRTNSMKSLANSTINLTRTPSTKTLNEKPPILKKRDSKKNLTEKTASVNSINKIGVKDEKKLDKKEEHTAEKTTEAKAKNGMTKYSSTESSTDDIQTQDIETQVDNTITNEKGELVILTKKSIVSMTTAAITAQPLEIVTTVTNQLPTSLEKAREKGIFERHSSKDSLAPKELTNHDEMKTPNETKDDSGVTENKLVDDKKHSKPTKETVKQNEDTLNMKPLQPPYNNPQVERVKQRIDDILKTPEVSAQNILTPSNEPQPIKNKFKLLADKTKNDVKISKNEVATKLMEIRDKAAKQKAEVENEIRAEATNIVNSIITPIEEPKEPKPQPKLEPKTIEPIVMVVNEKPKLTDKEVVVKTTETLVQGGADVEVQSSNNSMTTDKIEIPKMADAASEKSSQSNGGNQRFISNSTSSIHETAKIEKQLKNDKKTMSKSQQHLSLSPAHIRGKPPISPGRGGPPPSNKTINAKRLSPIVGTPNKSPSESSKPGSARTPTKPTTTVKKPAKTVGNTPAVSRFNSRQPSRSVSRDHSPDKRKPVTNTPASKPKPATKPVNKTVSRTPSDRTIQKPVVPPKIEPKKPINRTNSMKSLANSTINLTRTPSTKTLNEKPPILKKRDSKKNLTEKTASVNSINKIGVKDEKKLDKKEEHTAEKTTEAKAKNGMTKYSSTESSTDDIQTQDIETQVDNTITNEKGELVILTKKSIVSMTTAAITAQPLEIVTTVTNQLPTSLEKAREKGIFERHSSKDSLAPKELTNHDEMKTPNETKDDSGVTENKLVDDKKHSKPTKETVKQNEDTLNMKPLQPPYNNPQVERVKQRIDDILKTPEVSAQNILTPSNEPQPIKNKFKLLADKTKNDVKISKNEVATKLMEIRDKAAKQKAEVENEIRAEATNIVNSIITPIEEPKEPKPQPKLEPKTIEPIVMVVNEKPKLTDKEVVVKTTETLVQGGADVEVQSSNNSMTTDKIEIPKMADAASEKSSQSNGGFPQSTSTTPRPPARRSALATPPVVGGSEVTSADVDGQKKNICSRLLGKCAQRAACSCCRKAEHDDEMEITKEVKDMEEKAKEGVLQKLNCCRKKKQEVEEHIAQDLEAAAGKVSIDFENESQTKRKRKFSSVLCLSCVGCGCGARARARVSDSALGRRDSILSDRPAHTHTHTCCNNRPFNWLRGALRPARSEATATRRNSLFSKNKSLSPTLPSEDTRPKLDPSLIEHTSTMRGAIPILPAPLAYLCLICNLVVPGFGTILSGLFCLCFGIPRFGPHDGAKHRIGSFLTNIFVGCAQLFTVLFCLVGWGWSIWWGVIILRVSRKYRRLRKEELREAQEAAAAAAADGDVIVTGNNHARV